MNRSVTKVVGFILLTIVSGFLFGLGLYWSEKWMGMLDTKIRGLFARPARR
ncbi:MAG: hypothetical protein WCX65_11190 [bacterium]